jgi:hypothetical protein
MPRQALAGLRRNHMPPLHHVAGVERDGVARVCFNWPKLTFEL